MGHNSGKTWRNLFKSLSGNLLILSYQLTKLQAPSWNNFRDILLKSLKCPNLQRAITQILFKISCWQDFILIFSSPEPKDHLTRSAYSIAMVRCPSVIVVRHPHFQTWISLRPVGQSLSNFICSIIGVGKRLHVVLGQTTSKLWFPWQQKAGHWLIMGKTMSPC